MFDLKQSGNLGKKYDNNNNYKLLKRPQLSTCKLQFELILSISYWRGDFAFFEMKLHKNKGNTLAFYHWLWILKNFFFAKKNKVFKDLNQSVEMTRRWWWWLTEAINDFLLQIFFPSMKLYYLGWLTSTTGYSKKAITFYCTGCNI